MKSKNTFNTLNVVTTAMLSALAVILSTIMHHIPGVNMATAILLSPMHFPVLLIGILCGPWLGLIGGVLAPVVSFLMSGMASPPPSTLVPMIFELGMYGFLTGMMRKVFIKNPKTNRFASILALVIAMVAGRALNAVVGAIFLAADGQLYFVALWTKFAGNFTSTWAGIIIQLVLIPAILFALQRSGILLKYLPDTPMAVKAVASAVADESSSETAQETETDAETDK
ncbi:MAG: ECF transporter S component [Clostridiales bacterium]|nr:ECF transporter S component [Clostridiales bacterium]